MMGVLLLFLVLTHTSLRIIFILLAFSNNSSHHSYIHTHIQIYTRCCVRAFFYIYSKE